MPKVGDIVHGRDIGKSHPRELYIWVICPICQKGRWRAKTEITRSRRQKGHLNRCHHCSVSVRGKDVPNWKGGRHIDKEGYVLLYVGPDDFFYPMATKDGYIREHRLIMARHLGRHLHRWELVHHKNHLKTDNRLENLQLISDTRHNQITILEKRISYLESRLSAAGISF